MADGGDFWANVPQKKNRHGRVNREFRSNATRNKWSNSVPLSIEEIPQTSSNVHFSPFITLLIGLPGSGKSTFAQALQTAMPFKFVRVNQDSLGSRKACEKKVRQALLLGKCPIVDRCNFNLDQRRTWYEIAKECADPVPVHAVSLVVPKEECERRCQQREEHETVSPEDASLVIHRLSRQFQPPRRNETDFESFRVVRDGNAFNDTIVELLNQA